MKPTTGIPIATILLLLFSVLVGIWFFTGGSFKLYNSIFFALYFLTNQIWLSVILLGITQNLVFIPLRFLSMRFSTNLKAFEEKLNNTTTDEQYFVFKNQVRYGDSSVIFYIITFTLYAIAFFSAGKIFLNDFYSHPLNPTLLYSWVPYPAYPLQGTTFNFPWFNVTQTFALSWGLILKSWLIIAAIAIVPGLIWQQVKTWFNKNPDILKARIRYNRIYFTITSVVGTLFFISLYALRNLPKEGQFFFLSVDLTRQNTTMNIITAIATFLTVLHAGYNDNKNLYRHGLENGIEKSVLDLVFKEKVRSSIKNGLLLGIGAFLITNQIPSAFELSVAVFELLIFLSPYTIDKILHRSKPLQSIPLG